MSETKIGAGKVAGAAGVRAEADAAAAAEMSGGRDGGSKRPPVQANGLFGGGSPLLKPSWLQVAYSVSKWNENDKFGNGAFVLDREDQIARQTEPLTCVIVGASAPYYKQWTGKDTQGAAKTFLTREEAIAAGETVDWPAYGSGLPRPTVAQACDLLLLIERPQGCTSTRFVLKLGGKFYAPVLFGADKGLWKDIAADVTRLQLYDASQNDLPPGQGRLDRYFMRLWTRTQKKSDGNSIVHLNLAFDSDAGGPRRVPDQFLSDLSGISRMLSAAQSAQVQAPDDGLPPALDI